MQVLFSGVPEWSYDPQQTSRRRFTGLTDKKWSSTATPVYPALMPAFICTACGTQYAPADAPPGACPICTDERQFVPASGQSWTTLEGLRNAHSNKFRRLATGLMTIETTPAFGIGQRAILARTPAGNVLWDCLTLVRLGGHFDGGTVLHWADWSEGRGVLLSGDVLQVVPSGHVSFMWSYP